MSFLQSLWRGKGPYPAHTAMQTEPLLWTRAGEDYCTVGAPHGRVHLTSIEITACPDFLQQGQKGLGFLDNPQLQAHTSQTGQLIIQKYQVVYGMCTGAIKHHIFCMVLHSPSHKAGWCTCVAQPVNLLLSQSLTCATTHGLLPRTPQTEETVFTSLSPQ